MVGVKDELFDILVVDLLDFSVSYLIRDKKSNVEWRFIIVYGSAYDEQKLEFINELHNSLDTWPGPTLIGGDFNLVRSSDEKNTGSINSYWVNLFNDWINKYALLN